MADEDQQDRPVDMAPFRPLPTGPQGSPAPLRHFAQVRNLSDKQFGQVQVSTPERRFTPPAQQFSAWGAGGS